MPVSSFLSRASGPSPFVCGQTHDGGSATGGGPWARRGPVPAGCAARASAARVRIVLMGHRAVAAGAPIQAALQYTQQHAVALRQVDLVYDDQVFAPTHAPTPAGPQRHGRRILCVPISA